MQDINVYNFFFFIFWGEMWPRHVLYKTDSGVRPSHKGNCLEKAMWNGHAVNTAEWKAKRFSRSFFSNVLLRSYHEKTLFVLLFCLSSWFMPLHHRMERISLCLLVCNGSLLHERTGLSGFRSCFTQNQIIKKSKQGLEQYFWLFRKASDYKAPVGHCVCFHHHHQESIAI